MKPRVLFWLKIILALAGAYLFYRLIFALGWHEILSFLLQQWPTVALLTVVYITYHILRTWSLKICLLSPVGMRDLFGIRLAGEAVAYLAVGTLLGDALKVTLVRKKLPVVEGAIGIFAEKLIYHLSGTGFIILGLWIALIRFGAARTLIYMMAFMIALFFTLLFVMSSGIRPIARMIKNVKVRKPKLRQVVLETEESLFQFRSRYPGRFFLCFLLNFLSYFYSVVEITMIFLLLGQTPSFADMWYYESMVKMMNTANLLVPANLGIFEATNVFLAQQLNMGEQSGMIAALFIRLRALLWSLIGYIWFLHLVGQQSKNGTGK